MAARRDPDNSQPPTRPEPSEFDRFRDLTKRLLQVPKKEIKRQDKKKAG